MYMKLKDGKSKVGTFNINTGRYLPEDAVRERFYGKMKLSEAQALYCNSEHEVAVHTVNHTFIDRLPATDMMVEILEDRKNIEKQWIIPLSTIHRLLMSGL